MVSILLTLTLTFSLPITPQTGRRKKITKPKPIAAAKKVQQADSAREAIKLLRTMETVSEIGTTYSDYTARLADVKIKVDELLTKIPPDDKESSYRPKSDIERALESYVSAAHYWQMKIKNRNRELNSSYEELINLAWKSAKNYLNMATKGLDKTKPPTQP
jgi:hypothetical protein